MTYGTPLAGALSAGSRADDAALPHQAITGKAAIAAADCATGTCRADEKKTRQP